MVFTHNVKADVCGSEDDGFICCNLFHTFGHGNYLSTYDGKKIGPRFISVDTNFSAYQKSLVNNMVNSWNSKLSENANSVFYIIEQQNYQIKFEKRILESKYLGYTTFFTKGGSELFINNKKLNSKYSKYIIYIDTTQGVLQQTIAHELGHAMGLSHRFCNKKSIMYNYIKTIEVTFPQVIDAKTVYHIYS